MRRLGRGQAGVDEAGRGPLAGPVVVAAVVLPRGFDCEGLNDSKLLTRKARERLAERIRKHAQFSIRVMCHTIVDDINILQASLAGMRLALSDLNPTPVRAVLDGNQIPVDVCCDVKAMIKADSRVAEVAAASILAKTTRDDLMREYALNHPGYGFEHNFGYSTPYHLRQLRDLGPCEIHRRSFAPVRTLLEQPCLIGVD